MEYPRVGPAPGYYCLRKCFRPRSLPAVACAMRVAACKKNIKLQCRRARQSNSQNHRCNIARHETGRNRRNIQNKYIYCKRTCMKIETRSHVHVQYILAVVSYAALLGAAAVDFFAVDFVSFKRPGENIQRQLCVSKFDICILILYRAWASS